MTNSQLVRSASATAFLIGFTLITASCQSTSQKPIDEQAGKVQMAKTHSLAAGLDKRVYCGPAPLVFAHRGASGYAPEHTIAAYKLALDMGADFVEPDLVMTKDRYLIARHENELSETTDVEKKFPKRKRTKTIDGTTKEGWYSEDFSLSEIKSLRAKERLDHRDQKQNGLYEIPTFEEILAFVKLQEKQRGRKVGVIPEIKHSHYHHGLGFKNVEKEVVRLLHKYDFKKPDSWAIIQSFEVENLKVLRGLTKLPLMQLFDEPTNTPAGSQGVTYAQMATPEGLKAIRQYAEWVSPHKGYIVRLNKTEDEMNGSSFVTDAHAVGLKVGAYTFRSDAKYLAKIYEGDPAREYRLFFNMGVDGLFTDFPDHAMTVKSEFNTPCP